MTGVRRRPATSLRGMCRGVIRGGVILRGVILLRAVLQSALNRARRSSPTRCFPVVSNVGVSRRDVAIAAHSAGDARTTPTKETKAAPRGGDLRGSDGGGTRSNGAVPFLYTRHGIPAVVANV